MNLLYFHARPLDFGRADTIQVVSMCQAFTDLGINTALAIPKRENNGETSYAYVEKKYEISPNFKIIETGVPPEKKIKKYLYSGYMNSIVSKFNPDLVYVRNIRLLLQCLNKKLPVVYECHHYDMSRRFSWLNNYLTSRFKESTKEPNFLKLVTISERLKHYWINEGVNPEKVFSYHDGFIRKNYEKEISKEQAREKLGLKMNGKTIVYTGNLMYGLDKKIIELAKKVKNATFYIVGGPEENAKALKRVAEQEVLRHLIVIGPVPHKRVPLFQFSADVLLAIWTPEVPYIDSISPLKLFEYMATGRLVIADSFPTIQEVLRDGSNAVLADPNSRSDLSDKVNRAINGHYSDLLGKTAREEAFQKYTWDSRAEKVIQSL